MKPMIEFCASNMHHGTRRLLEKLEENPELDVIEYGCLGNCGECYLAPFALVNGEIVSAEDVEQLEERIRDVLKDQQADREALDKLIDDL
ncbi:YuzB family protein [Paenibacillus beijingensis]|uniref:UDP-N-acetylmuramoylalanine--D-glutamate ligase n=1 Tax=Paenibacillus beijingensis TaxID=1126833 RepID=A0A0D5NSA6_9BACL|nr:YuzB family protein [Paenibacillus beijingensis]AJY77778.1 UDP-N-acetylmuramoylalanine--D-glutamate ligase [Paenibacillus beijingensis]